MKDKDFYSSLLTVAIPAAFQALISLGVNMLDNIMVGALGDVALASASLANQATTLFTAFINGIAGGSAVLISQYWGKKDLDRIKSVFAVTLRFAAISASLIVLLMACFPQGVMRIFTSDAALIAEGASYVRIVCFSYLLFAVSNTVIVMFRWIEQVRVGIVLSMTSLFVNLILNYLLIFGKLGLPAMGIRGAALATVLTRAIELTIALVYLFAIDRQLCVRLRDLMRRDGGMLRDFFSHAVPIVVGDLQWGMVGAVKAMLIGRLGTMMVSANSIAEVVLALAMVFTNGLSNGACIVIGKTVGAGDYQKTRRYSNKIQVMFAIIGVAVGTSLILLRNVPPMFYGVSSETKALAAIFLAIGGFTHMGTCYHAACFVGINRGAGDGKFVMKVDMICGWLIVIPLTFLAGFVFHWPLPVVFLCTRIDQCFKWIIAFFRLRGDKWIQNVTRD